ncbi:MAG: NAD-dependent epimerase/dehydratase family protein [Pseudomonadales bacterium]
MATLVTGSAGHLGEALVRTLIERGTAVTGLDIKPSPFTHVVGSITDPDVVSRCLHGVETVFHTATLHKPHVATHSRQAFIDTNVSGTLTLLEESLRAGVTAFVFTSTTSVFGDALRPPPGEPATWVTESVTPLPRNIYGVTKTAAEELCHLFHRQHGLSCLILRTSRFFPEEDDDRTRRAAFSDANLKANEYLYRRVELTDVVSAHLLAAEKTPDLGFGRYIISATTPIREEDLADLNADAPSVVERRIPGYTATYEGLGWRMLERIDRVYVNDAARRDLGWSPTWDFHHVLDGLREGTLPVSPLARAVGAKGYHDRTFDDGPFPVLD